MAQCFTDTELRFLASRQQGRLATIGPDDAPQIHPWPSS